MHTSIDLTNFLNEFIKYRKLGLNYKIFKNFWFEIDNQKEQNKRIHTFMQNSLTH